MSETWCWRATAVAQTDLLLRASRRRDNVMASLDYVPGSALRGYLAGHWLRRNGAPDTGFRELFQSGVVRFENAYPMVEDPSRADAPGRWQRAWPAPLSLHACKTHPLVKGHDVIDLAGHRDPEPPLCQGPVHGDEGGALRRVRGFVTDGGLLERREIASVQRHRIGTVGDGSGLAASQKLYSERRVPESTRFLVEIRGPRAALELLDPLPERLSVGRARSLLGQLEVGRWSFEPESVPEARPGRLHTLTLLSDTVLLDGYQRARLDLASPEGLVDVCEALGETTAARGSYGPTEVRGAFVQTTTVGGWDTLNDIPKPVDAALAAGSVVVFEADDALVELLRSGRGLGWRQAEGCGRFVLDSPLHAVTFRAAGAASTPTSDERDKLARAAWTLAGELSRQRVTAGLWHSIASTLRTTGTIEVAADRPLSHVQAAAGRGAGAGDRHRQARTAAIRGFRALLERLGIDQSSPDALVLADDLAEELALLREGRGRR